LGVSFRGHRATYATKIDFISSRDNSIPNSEGIQAILSLEAHIPVSYLSIIYKSLTCP
jgi:hypothetical protein